MKIKLEWQMSIILKYLVMNVSVIGRSENENPFYEQL